MSDAPAARAQVVSIDGQAELVVTLTETGQTQRYALSPLTLAVLVETATPALGGQMRALARDHG